MGKLVWVAIGAAGGIYAYRRAQRAAETVRERDLVENLQAAGERATSIASSIRALTALLPNARPAAQHTIIVQPKEGS
ncbi:unannotated protein [freshwater metagenome]|uniref:Unannotated protein n=1 Tax=freshwater metagenome TaxID=449393 RepID=A0A6J7G251_9ZZZZ|nr:hypothetical protein [Actinomycetota bacterium]